MLLTSLRAASSCLASSLIGATLLVGVTGLDGIALGQSTPQGQGPISGANGTMDLNWLQNEMTNWGEWGRVEPWGPVWRPRNTPSWWQPYTRGHWAWCYPGGVVWQGDESWSWLTDHYGRWNFDQQDGWYWIPDTVWAPAWVCWAGCGEYVGWAPLPPELEVPATPPEAGAPSNPGPPSDAAPPSNAAAPTEGSLPDNATGLCNIPAWQWNFVQGQRLSSGEMAQIIVPRASNANMLARSVPLTNYTHEQGIIGCQPFSLEMVKQIPGWTIPAPPSTLVDNPMEAQRGNVGRMVPLFMPTFTGSTMPMQQHFDRHLPHHPSGLPNDGVNNPYVPAPLEQWNATAPATPQTPWEPYAPVAMTAQPAQPAQPVQPHAPVQPHQPVQPYVQPAVPHTVMENYLQERQQMEQFHHGQMQRLQLWQDYQGQNQPFGSMTEQETQQWQSNERSEYMRQVARQRGVVDGRYDGNSPFGLMQWNATPPTGLNASFGPGGAGAAGRR